MKLPPFQAIAAFGALMIGFAAAPASAADHCREVSFERVDHVVCEFNLDKTRLTLSLKDDAGSAYGSLRSFVWSGDGQGALVAMNAGMYERDGTPVGLYVEDGVQTKSANTRNGYGNFHLKPNGVFYVEGNTAGVLETQAYLDANISPDLATQSGPMLLVDGQLHPRFIPGSDSVKIRNGVGIKDGGKTVVFAISNRRVSFDAFARLFRDELGVRDALYLDGTISSIYAPELNRSDFLFPVGPILSAYPK